MRALLLSGGLGLLLCANAWAAVHFEPVAVVGDSAPDSGGGTYSVFVGRRPVISTAGHVYYGSGLSGSSYGSSVASYVGAVGIPSTLIVRNQAQVPDLPSGTLVYVQGEGLVNASGLAVFPADLTGSGITTSNNGGLFAGSSVNTFSTVYQKGSQAPGFSNGITFNNTILPRINNAGQLAFRAPLMGSGNPNDAAVWLRSGGGTLSTIARVGGIAPGTSVAFTTVGRPALNKGGSVAFGALLSETVTDGGIWYGTSAGTLAKLVRTGDPVPGAAGVSFLSPSVLRLSDSDRMVFHSTLAGSVTSANDGAIFAGTSSADLQMIAREDQHAPGTESGATFTNLALPTLVSGDRIVFRGTVAGSSFDDGIWGGTSAADLSLIAREGDSVPGLESGLKIGSFVDGLNANSSGQTVFGVHLTGPGVVASNQQALVAHDPSGGLELLARSGDMIDINGTLRQLRGFALLTGEGAGDGAFSAINDSGQVAMLAFFDEADAIVVLQVPEPATAGLVLLSALVLARCRSR